MNILNWFRGENKFLFLLMFAIVFLLNVNYIILKGVRNALVVTDLGSGGAGSIPLFELVGTFPGAVLMAYILTRLLNRFSIRSVFLIILTFFISFFLIFAVTVYPFLVKLRASGVSEPWIFGLPFSWSVLPSCCSMMFFVMTELWRIALLIILFWGMVNQYVSMDRAKKYYAPLMLGSSLGTIVAGRIIALCTSNTLCGQSWARSLTLMMVVVGLIGVLIAILYSKLWRQFVEKTSIEIQAKEESPFSLWGSIRTCFRSPYLRLLAWLTIADYVAYALGEVVFLEVLKQKFPDPREYCDFMGTLSFWDGVLTAFGSLVIAPYVLLRSRWIMAALITPLCLVITESAFFVTLWSFPHSLNLLIWLGSIFFCVVRAAKYALFDTSKEVSFVSLSAEEKMQGKLVVDGICTRLGKGGASGVNLALIHGCGGVLTSSSVGGLLGIAIGLSCVISTLRLGSIMSKNIGFGSKRVEQF